MGARLPLVEFDSLTLPQIGVALGLDEGEAADDSQAMMETVAKRPKRRPSPNRRSK